jgi:5'(3')-deoxyribonucleotidase
MKRKKVYVDMDGVLCDFFGAALSALRKYPEQKYPQSQWGFFLKLEEIEGAVESFRMLEEKFDVWILTRPSVHNLSCYTEKAQWIRKYLGFDMQVKLIICTDKSLLKGHYLVDDQVEHGQTGFEGKHLHFGTKEFPDWKSIETYLMKNKEFFYSKQFESECGC